MISRDDDFKRFAEMKNIYIYGAKNIANMVYDRLMQNGCKVEGFIVSRTLGNPDYVKGQQVYLVYDMVDKKEKMCIIVAVLSKYRKEVVELLLHLGFCNIITLSDKYTYEIKKDLDEKQRIQVLNSTDYVLEMPAGIESGHAILQRKDTTQSIKWRVELGILDQLQRNVDLGAWRNAGLTLEYERLYGISEQISHMAEESGRSSDIAKTANIYTIKCHVDKPVTKPIPYTYLKEIQAGAALTEQKLCDCTDNTGDNISDRNRDFSECSAIYWIWKNGEKKKYTGVCHYHRYLNISTEELQHQMDKGTTLINTVPGLIYPSIKHLFISRFLYEFDWLLMMETIKKQYSMYYETAKKFEKGHFYHANNIFIMKTEWFDIMCEFLFGVLLEIDNHYSNRRFERQDRYAGYLFEVLYSIFVMHHAKEMQIAYADMLFLN